MIPFKRGYFIFLAFAFCFLGLAASLSRATSASETRMDVSFLPAQTEAQKAFAKSFAANDVNSALSQWDEAYANTPFANSVDGRATFAYLAFQKGMSVFAFEELFSISNPRQMSAPLKAVWGRTATQDNSIWSLTRVAWNDRWNEVFAKDTSQHMVNRLGFYNIKSAKELKNLEAATTDGRIIGPTKAWLTYQFGLIAPLWNQPAKGAKALESLLESQQTYVGRDEIVINLARIYFQMKDFKTALDYYSQVPKSSDFWLESVEEKAWTYLREEKYGEALAQVQTLLSPVFFGQIGPEPYFLASMANLKVCDYEGVLKASQNFKERYRLTANRISSLAETGDSDALRRALKRIDQSTGPINYAAVGADAASLPRQFYRDEFVRRELSYRRALLKEIDTARTMKSAFARAKIEPWIRRATENANLAQNRAISRIVTLAKVDVKEVNDIIQKLRIMEGDVIQRILIAEKSRSKPEKGLSLPSKNDDELVFPATREVWVDEVDKYQAAVKGCDRPSLSKVGRK